MSGIKASEQRKNILSKHIQYSIVATPSNPLALECGRSLNHIQVAYEIFGKINEKRDNVILITHAFSGDSHVGTHPDEPERIGWWANYMDPGKCFDTNKYAFLCSNVLGGCMGTTGPSSINPETNQPYGLSFPLITIRDIVDVQKRLVDYLGIQQLVSVIGGSMGGMQALQWAISYPNYVRSVIPIATTTRLSPQGIAFNEVARRAIINDPLWNQGNYSDDNPPNQGLSLARSIGTITYLSDESMRNKFGRNLQNAFDYRFTLDKYEFQVESYLNHQGEKFIQRFDANSYLYLCKALDYFDLEKAYGSLLKAFESSQSRFLIMAFESDWLYPIYQSKQIVTALQQLGKNVSYTEIDSNYGHDAFLLEYNKMAPILSCFIDQTCQCKNNSKTGKIPTPTKQFCEEIKK